MALMTPFHELDKSERAHTFKYFSFVLWLDEQGWEPYYDHEDVYVNMTLPGRPRRSLDSLWDEYCGDRKPSNF